MPQHNAILLGLQPPADARLTLRLPKRLLSELHEAAAAAEAGTAATCRHLLRDALDRLEQQREEA